MKMAELEEKITADKYAETLADMVKRKTETLGRLEAKLRHYALSYRAGVCSQEHMIEMLEWIMSDICDEFGNCDTCPLEKACEFARRGCSEAYNCEGCPRLRVCLEREILEVNPMKEER